MDMRGEVKHADEITPKDTNQTVALDFMTSLMRQDIKAFTDLWTDNAI
ncbi:hypothetical protein SAMN05443432_108151 [Roseovarius litoreus]|uniref:Uncharacterized protein n=1 Tax=Roseovarius litoreus TaxID=1155722 RepID=A0A1M7JEL6_9RHOB|nr:hypothetical protein SAMN05443432_108151 [Roseovarius litoreus]